MKSFTLKVSGREEGPYAEAQIAQMFADGRVNRDTPCKPVDGNAWKSIDDFLPTLKYGTYLPPPSQAPTIAPTSRLPPALPSQRVAVVDLDIPFGSVLKIMFKWIAAAFIVFCCFLPVFILVWLIIMAVFAGLINGVMSNLQHP